MFPDGTASRREPWGKKSAHILTAGCWGGYGRQWEDDLGPAFLAGVPKAANSEFLLQRPPGSLCHKIFQRWERFAGTKTPDQSCVWIFPVGVEFLRSQFERLAVTLSSFLRKGPGSGSLEAWVLVSSYLLPPGVWVNPSSCLGLDWFSSELSMWIIRVTYF